MTLVILEQEQAKKHYQECVKKETAFSIKVQSAHKTDKAESCTFNFRSAHAQTTS